MTRGGGSQQRRIRIRLTGDQAQDLRALQSWLSMEEWFAEAERELGLKVAYRERDGTEQDAGPEGPPMGDVVVEIVLQIAVGVLTPVFQDLYQHAKTSVRAFTDNLSSGRRRVEGVVTVDDEPAGPPDGDPAAPGSPGVAPSAPDPGAASSAPSGRSDGEGGSNG